MRKPAGRSSCQVVGVVLKPNCSSAKIGWWGNDWDISLHLRNLKFSSERTRISVKNGQNQGGTGTSIACSEGSPKGVVVSYILKVVREQHVIHDSGGKSVYRKRNRERRSQVHRLVSGHLWGGLEDGWAVDEGISLLRALALRIVGKWEHCKNQVFISDTSFICSTKQKLEFFFVHSVSYMVGAQ